MCFASICPAQTRPSAPVQAVKVDAVEQGVIRRGPVDSVTKQPTTNPTGAVESPTSQFGMARVMMSLGLVIALILGMKFFGQKWFLPKSTRSNGRIVETLSRAIIGPKQQVLLIRVGKRRVLVVGDSGGKLAPLDQITDSDEIAELLGQLQTERSGAAAGAFSSLFGKSTEKYTASESRITDEVNEAEDDAAIVDTSVTSTKRDLESLLAKVRGVSSRLGS
jgi:flagellar biogenesis protein FliO